MKTHVLRTSILALLVTAAGYAQSSRFLVANVPFSFVAGGVTLNAGQYTVDQGRAGLIFIESADGKANVASVAGAVQRPRIQSASTLVFHRYGGVYFLSQIWTEGNNYGRQTPASRRERELEARGKAPDETIVLALR